MVRRLFVPLFALAIAACGPSEPPQGRKVVFPGAQQSAGDLQFTAPAGWEAVQPEGSMRKAQFRLGGEASGGDAEVAVFVFPGGGGSTQANIDRWIGQFYNPDGSAARASVETREAGGLKVTVVDVSGTYTPTMRAGAPAAGPQTDRRMLAAVIETGADPWFVRMIGHRDAVGTWEASFYEYLDSVRAG